MQLPHHELFGKVRGISLLAPPKSQQYLEWRRIGIESQNMGTKG
jgi:hypothetical protein